MRLGPSTCALACLLAGALALAGCGSSDSTETVSQPVAKNRPAPPAEDFPSPQGKPLEDLVDTAEQSEVSLDPAAMVFYTGHNRFPFGVFEKETKRQVDDADIALYIVPVPEVNLHPEKEDAKGADARSKEKALEEEAIGPFPARVETLATEPEFQAKTTARDPDAASAVYVSDIDFPSEGEWRIAAVIKTDEGEAATLLPAVNVGAIKRVPRPGEAAPSIHTPTVQDVGGDRSKLTTRLPPDTQNEVDYADALGREPIMLLFATPEFCQSRVCGPVVDVAEQVKHENEGKAAFIHMEIYNDNDPAKGPNSAVRAFRLPSEPWLFAIGRDGKVSTAIEGAFGVDAMTEALERVAG